MKKIILGLSVIGSGLFAETFEEIKSKIDTAETTNKIDYIQQLSVMNTVESNKLLIEQLFSEERKVHLSAVKYLKEKDNSIIPLILDKMIEVFDSSKDRYKLLLIVEKTDINLFNNIQNLSKEELIEFRSGKNKVSENINHVKEVKTGDLSSALKDLTLQDDIYFESELFHNGHSLDKKHKDEVIKAFIELKSDKNVEKNLKYLNKISSNLKDYLIEVLRSKLTYMKDYAYTIIETNNLGEEVINEVLDSVEIDKNYLRILLEFPNLVKYESSILNTYKHSSNKIKFLLSEICKVKGLTNITSFIEKEKTFETEKNKKIQLEKEEKLKLIEEEKKKEEEEKKKELEKIANIQEKTKKDLELKKIEEAEKAKAEKAKLQHEQEISQHFTIEELTIIGLDMPEIMLQSVIKSGDLELVEAIPYISKILLDESKNLELRKNCIFALTKIQHEKVVPVLEKAANSSNQRISFIAKKSLMSLKFKTLKK